MSTDRSGVDDAVIQRGGATSGQRTSAAATIDAALQRSVAQRLLDAVPAAAYLCDLDGRITSFNEHAVALWGRRPALSGDGEFYCGSFRLWTIDGQPLAHNLCWMALALRDARPYTACEAVVERPDGSRRVVLAHASPLHDDAGGFCGAMNVLVDVTAARQSELELRRTSHLLQAVADGTTDAVFVKDVAGRYLFFNEAAARFVGRPAAEVLGQTDAAIFDPPSVQLIEQHDQRVMQSGRVHTAEEELTAAGVTRTYLVTKAPYWDEAGNVSGVIGISRDITQRKQSELELRASQERLQALVAAVPDMIFRLDAGGVFIDCKVEQSAELIAPPEVFLGKHYRDVMPPPISQQITQAIDAARASGTLQTFEYELTLPHSPQHWYEARLMVAPDGHTLVVARNVTARRQAQDSLQQTQQLLRAIFDAEPECLKLIAADGSLLDMNAAGLAMIDATDVRQVLGRSAFDLIAVEHRAAYQAMHERVLRGAKERLEVDIIGLTGKRRSIETHAVPLRRSDHPQPWHLAISRDVTERKKLEEQFRQSQKMEAVGRLAGGVAHDFNNLLTVILGFSELLAMKLEAGSPLRASVESIQDASHRAAGLTRQLLAFSRKQLLAPTVLNLNDVVRAADAMLRRLIREDILMAIELEPRLDLVLVDRGQIEQVIMNLVVNARDTMPHGGSLLIATRNVDVAARPTGEGERRLVELSVTDAGHGMTDEIKARIFDPFFTTKELGKGTGLGLAVVHGIVSQSGGQIEVESRPGLGTTFRVRLPSAGSAADAAPIDDARPAAVGGNESILLVEDDDAVREFALLALRSLGYRVYAARHGAEALEMVQRERPAVDLLLTDVVMPEISGPLLAEMLRVRYPQIRVLFVSGYADDAIVERGLLQSATAFLHKPYAPQALAGKVREVLDDA